MAALFKWKLVRHFVGRRLSVREPASALGAKDRMCTQAEAFLFVSRNDGALAATG